MNRPILVHAEDLYPNVSSSRKLDSSTGQNSGGLVVTQEMLRILSQPGHLSIAQGGQKLRELYVERESHSNPRVLTKQTSRFTESLGFDATKLSDFGLCCYVGEFTEVQKVWSIRSPLFIGQKMRKISASRIRISTRPGGHRNTIQIRLRYTHCRRRPASIVRPSWKSQTPRHSHIPHISRSPCRHRGHRGADRSCACRNRPSAQS